MNDININVVNGGLGRRLPLTDMISGLIASAAVGTSSMVLGTSYKLNTLDDAIALGLSAEHDEANNQLVYEHIKEFFRINPNGTLWFRPVEKTVSYAEMLDPTETGTAKQLLVDAGGQINQLAAAYNPATAVTGDAAMLAAIPKAQLLVADAFTLHRPLHVLLEGRGFDQAGIVTDLHTKNAPGVSVMIGQDASIAALTDHFEFYGAVGTLLGTVSLAAVNVNVAWVGKFNVLGDTLVDWSISSTGSTALSESDLDDLNDSAYIFFRNHAGRAGIYFNDSHTATDLESDFLTIENNRTLNKAARLIRQALLPQLNAPVKVDPSTGFLPLEVVKAIEALGNKALEDGMMKNDELSGFTFEIDEEQDILASSNLECELSLIPTGTARTITIKIGFTNPFNS